MTPYKLPEYALIRVVWMDSSFSRGWLYPDAAKQYPDLDDGKRITSVGWVVASNDQTVTVASSLSEHGGVLNPLSVPWGTILECAEL